MIISTLTIVSCDNIIINNNDLQHNLNSTNIENNYNYHGLNIYVPNEFKSIGLFGYDTWKGTYQDNDIYMSVITNNMGYNKTSISLNSFADNVWNVLYDEIKDYLNIVYDIKEFSSLTVSSTTDIEVIDKNFTRCTGIISAVSSDGTILNVSYTAYCSVLDYKSQYSKMEYKGIPTVFMTYTLSSNDKVLEVCELLADTIVLNASY